VAVAVELWEASQLVIRLCAVMVLAVTLVGCGQARRTDSGGALVRAARASVDAAVQGNARALCASLTPSTRASLAKRAGLRAGTCVSAIEQRMRQGAVGADYKPLAAAIDRRSDSFVTVSATADSGLVSFAPPHTREFEVPVRRGSGGAWLSVGIIECAVDGCTR
jgi:hypothetical protein